jgi:hypothetical protein
VNVKAVPVFVGAVVTGDAPFSIIARITSKSPEATVMLAVNVAAVELKILAPLDATVGIIYSYAGVNVKSSTSDLFT